MFSLLAFKCVSFTELNTMIEKKSFFERFSDTLVKNKRLIALSEILGVFVSTDSLCLHLK